jgi:hypothetical protein
LVPRQGDSQQPPSLLGLKTGAGFRWCGVNPDARSFAKGLKMKKLIAGAAALVAVAGYAMSAWAACPPGTSYHCYPSYGGKMACGCQ